MVDIRFSSLAGRLHRSEIREILKLTRVPDTISFGGGLPDPQIFPYKAVEEASVRAIQERGNLALQYSPTEGEPFFKEQIVDYCKRHGESVNEEELLVVSSSQQALDLLAKILIDVNDPVIVERPCYVGTLQAFRAFGADIQGVDMDQDGIIPDKLERMINELIGDDRKPKFLYVIPDFQNPSGINLSLERRKELLRIATKYDLLIVEDSPYRELKYEGELIKSLYSLDTDQRVIQMKTFSKVFSPGFRIGWVAAPLPVIERMVMAKQGTDLCTSAYTSLIAAYLMKDGMLEKQIEIAKKLYARKAKVMLDAFEQYMPKLDGLWWSKPDGGMFLWLHLPEYMDTVEMIDEAIKLKVAYVVGTCFYTDGSGRNEMRLNYSYPTEEQIGVGMERISQLVKKRVRTKSKV
jgi:2-aminoadipate transaminase